MACYPPGSALEDRKQILLLIQFREQYSTTANKFVHEIISEMLISRNFLTLKENMYFFSEIIYYWVHRLSCLQSCNICISLLLGKLWMCMQLTYLVSGPCSGVLLNQDYMSSCWERCFSYLCFMGSQRPACWPFLTSY